VRSARLRRRASVALIAGTLLAWHDARAGGETAAAATSPGATCTPATFRVIVDVGHTAEAPGAISARGAAEFSFNLRLATLIERKLIEAGFSKTTLMIVEGAALPGLARRVIRANRSHAELLLSIHHDSVPDALLENWDYNGEPHHFSDRFRGHSIFVSYDNRDRKGSLRFAHLLGTALKSRGLEYTPHYTDKIMGHRRRELVDADAGVYRYDKLIVLRATAMPAVLLEAGSIINRDEEVLLGTPEHQAVIAAAAVEAVEGFCRERRPSKSGRITRPDASAKMRLRPAVRASAPTRP
jgi:N-acetylmuramoyl-L-alanine amidase